MYVQCAARQGALRCARARGAGRPLRAASAAGRGDSQPGHTVGCPAGRQAVVLVQQPAVRAAPYVNAVGRSPAVVVVAGRRVRLKLSPSVSAGPRWRSVTHSATLPPASHTQRDSAGSTRGPTVPHPPSRDSSSPGTAPRRRGTRGKQRTAARAHGSQGRPTATEKRP